MRIKVDLDNIEGSIQELKSEAMQNMLRCGIAQGSDGVSNQTSIRGARFQESRRDRLHEAFLECRKEADEVHTQVVAMLEQVNEIRDKLRTRTIGSTILD